MKRLIVYLPAAALILLAGCRGTEPAATRSYEYRRVDTPPQAVRQAPQPPSRLLEKKLQAMVIPRLEFREARMEDVVTYLSDWCRQRDPRGEGVNFILMPPSKAHLQHNRDRAGPRLTMNLRQVSMMDAIRLVAEVSRCHYAVTDKAVKLYYPGDEPTEQVVTRIYPVHPGFLNVIEKVEPSGRFRNSDAISTLR